MGVVCALSITIFNNFAQRTNAAANLLTVQKKRSRNPELRALGQWLEELRGDLSRERISQLLAAKGVPFGGSTLAQYEKGTVWAPDVGVLLGLSRIYGVAFETLARAVTENRKHPEISKSELLDLLRHGWDQASALSGGKGTDVTAPAAPSRLQQQHAALLAATEDVAQRLITMLAEQGVAVTVPADYAATRTRKPRTRARARKVG